MMIFVTPHKGARVRMPERNSTVMEEQGAWVPRTVHYEHLLAAGDIVLSDPQPAMPGTEVPVPALAARATSAHSKEK